MANQEVGRGSDVNPKTVFVGLHLDLTAAELRASQLGAALGTEKGSFFRSTAKQLAEMNEQLLLQKSEAGL